jgi:hypothetical protein
VGENGVRSRSWFDDGGSGAVCDRPFIGINRYVRSVLGDVRTVFIISYASCCIDNIFPS